MIQVSSRELRFQANLIPIGVMILFVLLGFLPNAIIHKLLSYRSWGRLESPARLAAASSAILIVGSTFYSARGGIACFLGYLASDFLCSYLFGPRLRSEIIIHHAASLLLASSGLWMWDESAELESATQTLLRMEMVNPFTHFLWLTAKEREMSVLKPTLFFQAFTTLLLFFWYRVIASARVTLQALALLIENSNVKLSLCFCFVVALAFLQCSWFYRLTQLVVVEHKKIR